MKLLVFNQKDGGGQIALNPAEIVAVDPAGPNCNVYTMGTNASGRSLIWNILEPFDKVVAAINMELAR